MLIKIALVFILALKNFSVFGDTTKDLENIRNQILEKESEIYHESTPKGLKGLLVILNPGSQDDAYLVEKLEISIDGRRVWLEEKEGGGRLHKDKLELMLGSVRKGDHQVQLRLVGKFAGPGKSVSENRVNVELKKTTTWTINDEQTNEIYQLDISSDPVHHRLQLNTATNNVVL